MITRMILCSVAMAALPALSATTDDNVLSFVEEVDTPADVEATIRDQFEQKQIDSSHDVTDGGITLGAIINAGKAAWKVIVANQPVADIRYQFANALPQGARGGDLAGFSDLQMRSYRIRGVNGYGVNVYDATITLVHQYGGSYNGKGKFLETVGVVPSQVNVLWGYKLNYDVASVAVVNTGTSDDPIASVAMANRLDVSSVMKKSSRTTLFQFRGDTADIKSTSL